jgi:hypothetical protein
MQVPGDLQASNSVAWTLNWELYIRNEIIAIINTSFESFRRKFRIEGEKSKINQYTIGSLGPGLLMSLIQLSEKRLDNACRFRWN